MPGISTGSGAVLGTSTAFSLEIESSDMLNVPPRTIGTKFKVARTPSPAGKLSPSSENPRAIPVSAANDISEKSDKTPVSSTPSVSNWNPPILTLELYKISADSLVTSPKANVTLWQLKPLPSHTPQSSTTRSP